MGSLIEPVEITLDKPRHLLFTNDAIFRAEREINRMRGASPDRFVAIEILILNAWKIASENLGILPMDLIAVLLWAGCRHEDPNLTVDQAVDLIKIGGMQRSALMEKLLQAFQRSRPPAAETPEEEGDKKKSPEPTGSGFAPSRALN